MLDVQTPVYKMKIELTYLNYEKDKQNQNQRMWVTYSFEIYRLVDPVYDLDKRLV